MIRVRTAGRMGNQMFQLAFAHATSRRLGTEFALGPGPRSTHATLGPPLWRFFELGPWGRPTLRWRRRTAFRLQHGFRADLVLVEQHDDPINSFGHLRDGVEYGGFFQSERWFEGYADEIRRLFTVRGDHQEEFLQRYPTRRPYICMHVRRSDYLDVPGGWALPTSYFLDALDSISNRDRYELIVVSDDPAAVRRELSDEPSMRCSQNSAMVDLQLLINADVVIASNSSFSWWGAWLNQRPGALVVAPKHWLGFAAGIEEPARVIPERWISLPVREGPLRRTALAVDGSDSGA
jgi:Glycosyl transferase family 11